MSKFLLTRQSAEQQQIRNLFESHTLFIQKAFCKIQDIDSTVIQFTVTRCLYSVNLFVCDDVGNPCQTRQNSDTVQVTQPALYFILAVQFRVHFGMFQTSVCQCFDFRCYFHIKCHMLIPLS